MPGLSITTYFDSGGGVQLNWEGTEQIYYSCINGQPSYVGMSKLKQMKAIDGDAKGINFQGYQVKKVEVWGVNL